MSYRIRYTIEEGEFDPVKGEEILPGVRKHGGSPNEGFTDSISICSIIMDDGEIESVLWAIDPKLRPDQVETIRQVLDHHLEEHLGMKPKEK